MLKNEFSLIFSPVNNCFYYFSFLRRLHEMQMFNSKRMFHGRHKVSFRGVFQTQLHRFRKSFGVRKVGDFSGPYFPVFSSNTGKYRPEKTAYLDTFHAGLRSRFVLRLRSFTVIFVCTILAR